MQPTKHKHSPRFTHLPQSTQFSSRMRGCFGFVAFGQQFHARSVRMITWLAVVAGLVLPAVAEPHMSLSMYLLAIDTPLTKTQLQTLGAEPEGLLTIAADATKPRYLRMRAMSAFGVLEPKPLSLELRQRLLQLLQNEQTDIEVRIQGVSVWTALLGAKALPQLQQWRAHGNPEIRAAAERNLTRNKAHAVQP